jgi:transcriptional antiterminator NusG
MGDPSNSSAQLPIKVHDQVRVTEGTFAEMQGRVDSVGGPYGLVRITITIFGRPVPVELEATQLELVP